LRRELEDDLNGVGAPLAGLIRSIRVSNAVTTATVAIVCATAFFDLRVKCSPLLPFQPFLP